MDPGERYNECLLAMTKAQREAMIKSTTKPTRERQTAASDFPQQRNMTNDMETATRGSVIASMVPDEIILQHSNYEARQYETALMLIDASGFTDLCEKYTKADHGSPSRLTQVLNSYIGSMVQEILTHGGDILNFSGDAILSMWKKLPSLSLQGVVHMAIDCGLSIQKNYGTHRTDVGVILKVKIAISAGVCYFALIGDATHSHYLVLGQPVWDIKLAEFRSKAGDVIASPSAWRHANEADYTWEFLGDGRHTRVLQTVGSWKRYNQLQSFFNDQDMLLPTIDFASDLEHYYKKFSLRPVIVSALRSQWWHTLRKFMVQPVIWAVENDEPMEFLTEIRRVVIVFLNIITKTVSDESLVEIVDTAFKCIISISSEAGGLLNKVSLFDKDLMFLLVFGLRGMSHGNEAQKSLLCAQAMKDRLVDPNIISVSIGISSGTTYCGVVGHFLRREYTVIGTAANKAARFMTAYPNRLVCDKETFLRSKMDQDFFRAMVFIPMKGIKRPGPVYEFNKYGWPEKPSGVRQPVLGRNEELKLFLKTFQQAMQQQHEPKTEDLVYGLVFLGPVSTGKARLIEECIYLTPNCVRIVRISITETEKTPYGLFRQLALKTLASRASERDKCESAIRTSLDLSALSPVELYAINTIFGCRLPLPEDFEFVGDILEEQCTKNLVHSIFENNNNITSLCIVVIEWGINIDDESWRLLLVLLDTRTIFVLMGLTDVTSISEVGHQCLSTNKLLQMTIPGLKPCYHSAIACQFLDVQAIPIDLEKLIQSASGGLPGWIQNFIISLVQQDELNVEPVTRAQAMALGTVLPAPSLLYTSMKLGTSTDNQASLDAYFREVLEKLNAGDAFERKNEGRVAPNRNEQIQMAVLSDTFDVLKINTTLNADVPILKTYDSLTPFEKMLLKCCSVMGVVFPRRMIEYLMECDSQRKIAEAVAKLFSIGVLKCEGGDFTQETSKVLVHQARMVRDQQPPYCFCRGTEVLKNCTHLPKYAFCGYMRFRSTLFRTTTYELLTEVQKHDLHSRALLYFKKYTRRCWYCGESSFRKLMGKRTNDGLIEDSEELKNTQEMIRGLAEEMHQKSGELRRITATRSTEHLMESTAMLQMFSQKSLRFTSVAQTDVHNHDETKTNMEVRSFSSLDVAHCECLSISFAVYSKLIDHLRGAGIKLNLAHNELAYLVYHVITGQYAKLFESYLEYASLCVTISNEPRALCLLNEAETVIHSNEYWSHSQVVYRYDWFKDFCLGRIASLRGVCMLQTGELIEARKLLTRALELFHDPFPTTKYQQMVRNTHTAVRHWLALKVSPKGFIGTVRGIVGFFYDEVATTLNRLYKLFIECKEFSNAELTAKWSFDYALRSNSNFQVLCECYGNMITTQFNNQEFSKCVKLVKLVTELCRRKRGRLDAAETRAVGVLYTTMFRFFVERGKKNESLDFGLPVMYMVPMLPDPSMRVRLAVSVLRLLLSDLRLKEMVILMKEKYTDAQFDLSPTTWYYTQSLMILIETGYCVESYQECERFYMQHGDTIVAVKGKDAAWDYFGCMWLITVRASAWEGSVLWEEKVTEIMSTMNKQIEYNLYLHLILLEGWLITLVREIDAMNENKIAALKGTAKKMLDVLSKSCRKALIYQPRYFLLLAYFNFIRGNKFRAHSYLEKTIQLAKELGEGTILTWAEHTRKHWTGSLNPEFEDYWIDHIEPDNLLDYSDFNKDVGFIPFTLPLPRAILR